MLKLFTCDGPKLYPGKNGELLEAALIVVTRMRDENVCVAAVNLQSEEIVRPLVGPRGDNLTEKLLPDTQGQAPALYADVGVVWRMQPWGAPQISPPHCEDLCIDLDTAVVVGTVPREAISRWVCARAQGTVHDCFPWLQRRTKCRCGRGWGGMPGQGQRSIAFLRPNGPVRLRLEENAHGAPTLRLRLRDPNCGFLDLSLTDRRFYRRDPIAAKLTPNRAVLDAANDALRKVTPVLCLGLTREFRGYCWLQANALFFPGAEGWTLVEALSGKGPY